MGGAERAVASHAPIRCRVATWHLGGGVLLPDVLVVLAHWCVQAEGGRGDDGKGATCSQKDRGRPINPKRRLAQGSADSPVPSRVSWQQGRRRASRLCAGDVVYGSFEAAVIAAGFPAMDIRVVQESAVLSW